MTRKTHRQRSRSRRVRKPPSHLERSPRQQPPPSAGPSVRLIVCPTAGLHVYQTFNLNGRFIVAKNLLPQWHSFSLHPQLYASLYSQKFVNPTSIQSLTIPKALGGRDVIGVAETVCP